MAILGLDIEVVNDDIVSVGGSLYIKNPEALARLLNHLKAVGYEVENLRQSKRRQNNGVSVEAMEKGGLSLWFARLPDIRYGKCKSCNSYISMSGIQSHGHRCEACGEITYYDVVDGSTMRFKFANERYRSMMMAPQLNMVVRHWDTDEGFIYFYREFRDGGMWVVTGEQAEHYLAENTSLWEEVEVDGLRLLKIRYSDQWDSENSSIKVYDSYGHHYNYQAVKLWNGTEYGEWDRLPVPEHISVYESWHWAPLPKSPTLHKQVLGAAGQTDDKGWHYQDGRPWFNDTHWREMGKFIRHFTDLDADAYDLAWPRFRKDGPGGIDDIAHFCHHAPAVENRPNFGNALVALGKAIEGQPLTGQELYEAERGIKEDPLGRDFLDDLL